MGEAPSNVNVKARTAIRPGIVWTNEQNGGEREMADDVTKFLIRPEIKWFAEVIVRDSFDDQFAERSQMKCGVESTSTVVQGD